MANDLVFRSGYDFSFGDRDDYVETMESLTVQSSKDECDINLIIERANKGINPPLNKSSPIYGDFSEVGDYAQALEKVRAADQAFGALPSSIRSRFNNDPAQLVNFVRNVANRDEAVRLGLVEPPPAPAAPATPTTVAAPAAGASAASETPAGA